MRVAARARALSPVVHAVEDGGAVCGARPAGVWRLASRWPVTCASCLLSLSTRRFALCEVAQVSGRSRAIHVRSIGDRGFRPRDGVDTRTLCGQQPSWDLEMVVPSSPVPPETCGRCVAALSSARSM